MELRKALFWGGWIAVLSIAGSARGQRVQLPSPPETGASTYASPPPSTFAAPSTSPSYQPQGVSPTAPQTFAQPPSGVGTYGGPAATNPTYVMPPSANQSYGGTPGAYPSYQPQPYTGQPPAAALDGRILPPPSWDPYAPPGGQSPYLFQQDPYLQGPPPSVPSVTAMTRFLQEVRLDYQWMAGNAVDEFGSNDIELSSTFAFPLFFNPKSPILVTPGFATHFLSGPKDPVPKDPAGPADLPPRVYDAYLDTFWAPQITPWLGAELDFRIGIYSDFQRVTNDSIRYTGGGLAVLSFSPSFQIKFGARYLDRNRIKLLPAGGVVWTPNPDIRFEILFPEPRFTQRLSTVGNTEWWWYLRGEYGGGNWTINRAVAGEPFDWFDYNDIRVAVGLEFIRLTGLRGLFEVGFAFEREIRYRTTPPPIYYPNSTVFVRGGLAF